MSVEDRLKTWLDVQGVAFRDGDLVGYNRASAAIRGLLAEDATAGTCDTCKFWEPLTFAPIGNPLGCGACSVPKITSDFPKGDEAMKADDGEDEMPEPHLVTGPKFGCIHHEPK